IAAVMIQLGLAAIGAHGLAAASVQALEHASRWLTLAWTAHGQGEQIAAASREFLRMLVSIAMAALAYLGVKGNVNKAAAIAKSMPPALPAFALADGVEEGAAAGAAVKTGGPSAYGPFGNSMAMSTKDGGEVSSPEEAATKHAENAATKDAADARVK